MPKRRDARAPAYPSTEQHLHGVNYGRESANGRGRIPKETNGIGETEETTETESRSPLATVDACTVPGWLIPGKFGYQPIKLELYPLAHTYSANCVRVHLRHLGVYKESRVAYRAIRVRVS